MIDIFLYNPHFSVDNLAYLLDFIYKKYVVTDIGICCLSLFFYSFNPSLDEL